MDIESRPGPDGRLWTHTVRGVAEREPDGRFTDSIRALSQPDDYPMVTTWMDGDHWVIEVSLLTEAAEPTDADKAALFGTLNEATASTRLL